MGRALLSESGLLEGPDGRSRWWTDVDRLFGSVGCAEKIPGFDKRHGSLLWSSK